jgi:hypothetical protein
MAYAQGTTVSAAKSKMEIELLLKKRKAKNIATASTEQKAVIAFELDGRLIRIELTMLQTDDLSFQTTPSGRRRHDEKLLEKSVESENRRRWRALLLIMKAKLEAISSGISTTEAEFLHSIVVPGGGTVGQWCAVQLEAAYTRGVQMPPMLGSGT